MTGEIHDAGGLAFSDPRLTPKFTIVKRGVNSIIKQTPSNESARSTFERQFSNIFNEEDVGGFAANHEEDLVSAFQPSIDMQTNFRRSPECGVLLCLL